MNWPPNKAWTSIEPVLGYRHFIAINYGGDGIDRWVNLVSVLDGNARLRVLWKELKITSRWKSGWLYLPKGKDLSKYQNILISDECCLHPSEDSGLLPSANRASNRPWFLQ